MKNKTITITFVPQAWAGHRGKDLVDAEPKGKTTFQVPRKDIDGKKPRSESADAFKYHSNAPPWIEAWGGPYEFDWNTEDA